jgi:hypothetical protein
MLSQNREGVYTALVRSWFVVMSRTAEFPSKHNVVHSTSGTNNMDVVIANLRSTSTVTSMDPIAGSIFAVGLFDWAGTV